ncbi:unnamed protein product, partial [Timema podura]|nr:unnamed protein product [Timema podura]
MLCTSCQAHHSKTGDLYPPIINLLHQARLDPDDVRAKQLAALHGDVCLDDALIMNGHEVTYLNCVSTGTHGDVRVIEQGMNLVLQGHTQKINSKVLFECQEMAVSVTDVATNKSEAARGKFCAQARDQSCNISKSFTCYVFFCSNEDHTNNILQSIGAIYVLEQRRSNEKRAAGGSVLQLCKRPAIKKSSARL